MFVSPLCLPGSMDSREFAAGDLVVNFGHLMRIESVCTERGLMLRPVVETYQGVLPGWYARPDLTVHATSAMRALMAYGEAGIRDAKALAWQEYQAGKAAAATEAR